MSMNVEEKVVNEGEQKVSGKKELKSFREIEVEIKGLVAANKMLTDYQRETRKDKKRLCKIILSLIVAMVIEAGLFIGAFCWYESQFDVVDTTETTTTTTTTTDYSKDMSVSGENASINNVEGDQYNNDAVHNDGN